MFNLHANDPSFKQAIHSAPTYGTSFTTHDTKAMAEARKLLSKTDVVAKTVINTQ